MFDDGLLGSVLNDGGDVVLLGNKLILMSIVEELDISSWLSG